LTSSAQPPHRHDLPVKAKLTTVGRMLGERHAHGGLVRREHGVALDGRAVGVLGGAERGGDSSLVGGDGLAVAAAVGAFGQALAALLELAEVGFALVGVGCDGGVGGDRS
jgi:hypothetical protein